MFKLTLVLLFGLQLAAAQAATLSELAELKERPVMELVSEATDVAEFEGMAPANAPNFTAYAQTYTPWVDALIEEGPRLIAAMEKAFPNATWVFMGRDSQLVGDLVEGFYLSLGQKDRVKRLMVSSASTENADKKKILGLFAEIGLNLKTIKDGHPLILVDTISKGHGRQGRRFLDAAYSQYVSEGGSARDLVRKLNFFGLVVSTFQGEKASFELAETTLKTQEDYYSLVNEKVIQFFDAFKIITYEASSAAKKPNEAGYEHYTGAWTGSFGEIEKDKAGRYRAKPGQLAALEMRLAIVWCQAKVWMAVRTEKFKESVFAAAKSFGYRFSLERPVIQAPTEPTLSTKDELNLKELIEDMHKNSKQYNARQREFLTVSLPAPALQSRDKSVETTGALTANGEIIMDFLKKFKPVSSNDTNIMVQGPALLSYILRVRNEHQISRFDFEMLFNNLISQQAITEVLVETIEGFSNGEKWFKKFLNRESALEVQPAPAEILKIETLVRILNAPKTCRLVVGKAS